MLLTPSVGCSVFYLGEIGLILCNINICKSAFQVIKQYREGTIYSGLNKNRQCQCIQCSYRVNNNNCTLWSSTGRHSDWWRTTKRQQLFAFSLIKSALQSHVMSTPAIHPPTHRHTNTHTLTQKDSDAQMRGNVCTHKHPEHLWVVSKHVWLCLQWLKSAMPEGLQIARSQPGRIPLCMCVIVCVLCVPSGCCKPNQKSCSRDSGSSMLRSLFDLNIRTS